MVHIAHMKISVTEAKGQLTDLVRRAAAGEDVVLTRDGQPSARVVPVTARSDTAAKAARIEAIVVAAAGKAEAGPVAARSQDVLYDAFGLPR
jgi:prevent-host-death family protein